MGVFAKNVTVVIVAVNIERQAKLNMYNKKFTDYCTSKVFQVITIYNDYYIFVLMYVGWWVFVLFLRLINVFKEIEFYFHSRLPTVQLYTKDKLY